MRLILRISVSVNSSESNISCLGERHSELTNNINKLSEDIKNSNSNLGLTEKW